MSPLRILSRALRAETLACTHCGSADVYGILGTLGLLGSSLGLARYTCRACRRCFWLRAGAHPPVGPPSDPELEPFTPPSVFASLDALDADVVPSRVVAPDLDALDTELALIRDRRRRGSTDVAVRRGSRLGRAEQWPPGASKSSQRAGRVEPKA